MHKKHKKWSKPIIKSFQSTKISKEWMNLNLSMSLTTLNLFRNLSLITSFLMCLACLRNCIFKPSPRISTMDFSSTFLSSKNLIKCQKKLEVKMAYWSRKPFRNNHQPLAKTPNNFSEEKAQENLFPFTKMFIEIVHSIKITWRKIILSKYLNRHSSRQKWEARNRIYIKMRDKN